MSGIVAVSLLALIAGGGLIGPLGDRADRSEAASLSEPAARVVELPVESPVRPQPVQVEAEPLIAEVEVPYVLPEVSTPTRAEIPPGLPAANERCIQMMAGFPDSSPQVRYKFYRLVQATAVGTDDTMMDALVAYGGDMALDTPVIETVEAIANPVMRQAAPELIVAQTAHLIGFARECSPFIDGQVRAYLAADESLADPQFNQEIGEDALFLRSVLLDTLYRLEADADPYHGVAVARYQRSLVVQRDEIEFAAFDSELAELEALALGDLGDRLDMANASVNDTLDQGQLDAAIGLSRDMSESYRRESRARMAEVFIQILGRY